MQAGLTRCLSFDRAKTDGRIYVTNLRAPSVIEDDLWQAYTIGDEKDFCDIIVPFSDFIATHRGFIEGQIDLDARVIESVGILMVKRRAVTKRQAFSKKFLLGAT